MSPTGAEVVGSARLPGRERPLDAGDFPKRAARYLASSRLTSRNLGCLRAYLIDIAAEEVGDIFSRFLVWL
jgi:hypothetical protein